VAEEPFRQVVLEGACNFRDLGGYPTNSGQTAWGRLYRSDGLTKLTPSDIEALEALGLRTVVDLRHASELELYPNTYASHPTVRYHHNPIRNVDPVAVGAHLRPVLFDVAANNQAMLRESGETFAYLFHLLADAVNYPLVFHCTGGRDRTGVAAALVLAASGVPPEVIAADYVLSNELLASRDAELMELLRAEGTDPAILDATRLRQEYVLGTLNTLETEFGGPDVYLQAQGLTPAELTSFREMFTLPQQ